MTKQTAKLTIFYDGSCGVCSSEMKYYRSIADDRICFVNIASADFHAEKYGRTEKQFMEQLHVCDNKGRFFTGVEAFRKLWEELPSPFYPLLSTLFGLPFINFAAHTGYAVFARFRHLFPNTATDTCEIKTPHHKH